MRFSNFRVEFLGKFYPKSTRPLKLPKIPRIVFGSENGPQLVAAATKNKKNQNLQKSLRIKVCHFEPKIAEAACVAENCSPG